MTTTKRSESVGALGAALAKAQAEMTNPAKDKINPHFRAKYADLATVRDAVVPKLAKHGIAITQLPCDLDGQPALVTLLVHSSGEWIETTQLTRPGKGDPQGIGSALTYARRYALQAMTGVAADDDDDGNAASEPPKRTNAPAPKSDLDKAKEEVAANLSRLKVPKAKWEETIAAHTSIPLTLEGARKVIDVLSRQEAA
jgi:hypothetical protein